MSLAEAHTKTKQLIPELRFPEFVGEWNYTKLGTLGQFKGGGTPATVKEEYWSGEIPWISSSDINEGDIFNLNITRYLTDLAISESATKVIPENSVLFVSRVGVGKLAVNKTQICTSQDFANLTPENSDSYYLAYYFLARNKLLHRYSQGTSIKGFTTGDLKSVPINIPSLPEQQKIARFLSAVDENIQQLSRKKELLEQYKKGVMQQIFSQEIRFRDENGNDFPDWEEKRIGELTNVIAGGTPSTVKSEYWGGTIRWMNSGELNLKHVHEVENRITQNGLKNSSTKLIPLKCVLIGLAGQGKTRGTVAMNYVELCTNQSIAAIFPSEFTFIPEYLYQNLDFRYEEIRKLSTGEGGRGGLNLKIIKAIKVPLPSINEQKKIAEYINELELIIKTVSVLIKNNQEFKNGLLQKMFV